MPDVRLFMGELTTVEIGFYNSLLSRCDSLNSYNPNSISWEKPDDRAFKSLKESFRGHLPLAISMFPVV